MNDQTNDRLWNFSSGEVEFSLKFHPHWLSDEIHTPCRPHVGPCEGDLSWVSTPRLCTYTIPAQQWSSGPPVSVAVPYLSLCTQSCPFGAGGKVDASGKISAGGKADAGERDRTIGADGKVNDDKVDRCRRSGRCKWKANRRPGWLDANEREMQVIKYLQVGRWSGRCRW